MTDIGKSPSYKKLGKEPKNRFDRIARHIEKAFDVEIIDCFVSSLTDAHKALRYGSFFMFSDRGITECDNPMAQDSFDLVALEGAVGRIDVACRDFNMARATRKSRLTITVVHGPVGGGEASSTLQAVGKDCEDLVRVLKKHFVPNLAKGAKPRE